jgi:predicted nucleic acid-binding protein
MSEPKRLFFDTCFYIDLFRGKISDIAPYLPKAPTLIIGHAIVFMELYQGVRTAKEEKAIDEIQLSLDLIGPEVVDYIEGGHVLKKMTDRRWLQSKRLYEMQNDVLLAQSAARTNTAIVTRNKKDFEKIGHFCPVHTVVY